MLPHCRYEYNRKLAEFLFAFFLLPFHFYFKNKNTSVLKLLGDNAQDSFGSLVRVRHAYAKEVDKEVSEKFSAVTQLLCQ